MVLPPSETGAVKATLAWAFPAVATGLVGASGSTRLARPPMTLVHVAPLNTCISPDTPQLLHHTVNPATGDTICVR